MRIVATLGSPDHTIGGAGIVPWTIPDARDRMFEEIEGQIVVMGRRAWELVGRELPYHRAVVLSRGSYKPSVSGLGKDAATGPDDATAHSPGTAEPSPSNPLWVPNLELALRTAEDLDSEREVLVVGGASIFRQALPLAEGMLLAVIKCPVPGDLYFPDFSDKEWWVEESWEHPSFELLRYGRRIIA